MGELDVICIGTSVNVRTNSSTRHLYHTFSYYFCHLVNKHNQSYIMALSQCRQNYHQDCEAGINKQINLELYASYVYQSMYFYFDRDDIALPGFAKFFNDSSKEERAHAEILMKFQNQRGGRIVLHAIADSHKDPQMCDMIESNYLNEQVEAIKQIGDYITRLKRVGPGVGEFLFDKELQG